jgi:antitoxin component of RelBE/YafQ-DinJ toxin-antitoxin module
MHTIAIECSDRAYSHILYFLENLPKDDVVVFDDYIKEPNQETIDAINELENGEVEVFKSPKELFEKLKI